MSNNDSQKLNEDFIGLTALEKGQRCTIVMMSDFGIGVCSKQITLEEIKVSTYAQYSESVQLIFKLKGARKLRGLRFHGSESFAIWKGWQDRTRKLLPHRLNRKPFLPEKVGISLLIIVI